jgi:predicted O-methyltransferase YrrM
MKKPMNTLMLLFQALALGFLIHSTPAQGTEPITPLDEKVAAFLEGHRDQWVDWNVSEADGRVLHDLIVEHRYKNALDIGTSTGHSAIWMAWALSKTGGKLITIEIHEGRYRKALKNFEKAGLSEFIDARLADAHVLVRELTGPFDFVFCDADKGWYKNYFKALAPKLKVGGCFSSHNVLWRQNPGIRAFLDHVESLPHFETTIIRGSGEGISLSYKRAEK